MLELADWFANQIRKCPACLRAAEKNRILCVRCANYIQPFHYRTWARWQEGVPVLSLYEWSERAHGLFQIFANSLKGGGTQNIYQTLAAEMIVLRAQQKKFADKTTRLPWVIVPAPAAQESLRDHAGELAFQIAKLTGAEFQRLLRRITKTSQKQKSLQERWSGTTMKLKYSGPPRRDRLYIWVDDVVTTGSTANSAYKLLGRPPFFEIWTLFNRPRLRARG